MTGWAHARHSCARGDCKTTIMFHTSPFQDEEVLGKVITFFKCTTHDNYFNVKTGNLLLSFLTYFH